MRLLSDHHYYDSKKGMTCKEAGGCRCRSPEPLISGCYILNYTKPEFELTLETYRKYAT